MADLFLIEGSLEQYFSDFNLHGFALLPTSLPKRSQINQLAIDRPRTSLFSTSAECKKHIEIWSEKTKETRTDRYIQGNPEACNLFENFHRDPKDPFSAYYTQPYNLYKKEELAVSYEHAMNALNPHFRKVRFSYIDEEGNTRGLTISYRKDDPGKWMIALTANANRSPELAQAKLLTPFNAQPWSRPNGVCKQSNSPAVRQNFINAIGSKKIASFLNQVIGEDGNLDPNVGIIKFFTQPVSESFVENDSLMSKFNNDCLKNEALIKLNSHLEWIPSVAPVASIEQCLNKGSKLYEAICSYKLVQNESKNQRHLGLLLFIDEHNLWDKKDVLLKDENFANNLYCLVKNSPVNRKFLASCLTDDKKLSCLKLLVKGDESQVIKLIEELRKIPGEKVWKELKKQFASKQTEVSTLEPFLKIQKIKATATKFHLGAKWKYDKTPPAIRDELSRAIDYLTNNKASKIDYEWVFSVFADLPREIEISGKTTEAFLALYWEMKPLTLKKAKTIYKDLQNNPIQAKAIAGAAANNLKIKHLYLDSKKNNKIIQALNKITTADSTDKAAHELAMKDDAIGQQFRLLVNKLTVESTRLLICFLSTDIDNRKLLGEVEVDEKYYQFHFEVFEALSKKAVINDSKTKMVAVGFALCKDIKASVEEAGAIFDYLLKNPDLVETIESTMAHHLPVSQYYLNPEDPQNKEKIVAFKTITQSGAGRFKEAYELAMENDEAGRDFRLMLASPAAKKFAKPLIEFFLEELYARKLSGDPQASAKDYQKLFNFFTNLPSDVKIAPSKIDKPLIKACLALCEVIDPVEAKDKNVLEVAERLAKHPAKLQKIKEATLQKNRDFNSLKHLLPEDPTLLKFVHESINKRRLTKDTDSPDLTSCRNRRVQVNMDGLDQLLVTVNQFRDLGLKDEVFDFMLDRKNKMANDFYRIARKLEHKSSLFMQELPKNYDNYDIFIEQEKQYRKELLEALFQALKPNAEMTQKRKIDLLRVRVKAAEDRFVKQPILAATDDPVSRKITQFFVNLATLVLSAVTGIFGYLHYQHHAKTGDLLFYSSPKLVEDYKILDYEILQEAQESITEDTPKPKK